MSLGYEERVLVVSTGEKGRAALCGLLQSGGFQKLSTAAAGGDARRTLLESEFDLVVLNAPFPDEFGDDLAAVCAEQSCGVILIVKAEQADELAAKVEDYGVLVVEKPVNRQLFFQAVRLVLAARRRALGLKRETVRLQDKIEEIRLVSRAKCVLIEVLGMTEPQAHRYIEKQAMDLRCTRREVAQSVLGTYER